MPDIAPKRFQWAPEGGFTSGAGSVYNGGSAVPATRRLAVENTLSMDWDDTNETAAEARGTYAAQYTHAYHQTIVKGKMPALMYVDDFRYVLRAVASGAPTVTTLPATPTALLAATAIAASMSVTTQPNATADAALSKMLAVTLANASATPTAVTVTVNGTGLTGGALSEVLNFSAGTTTSSKVGGGSGALSVTLYTVNAFATITTMTTSAQPASDTVAVGGVNGFLEVYTADMGVSTLLSNTAEYFDGAAAWQVLGLILDKVKATAQIGKSFKVESDILAQQRIPLAAVTGSINPSALAGTHDTMQNLADMGIPALATNITRFYVDPQGAAAGTTLVSARLTEYTLAIDNQVKLVKTGDPVNYPKRASRGAYGPHLGNDFTLLFQSYSGSTSDPAELGQFLNKASRTVRCAFGGPYLPCGQLSSASGWPPALLDQQGKAGTYGVMFDTSGRYTKTAEKVVEGLIAHTYTLSNEVDLVALGTSYIVTIVTRVNPNA